MRVVVVKCGGGRYGSEWCGGERCDDEIRKYIRIPTTCIHTSMYTHFYS